MLSAQLRVQGVAGDAVEPAGEAIRVTQLAQVTPGVAESILRQITGTLIIAEPDSQIAQHPLVVASEQDVGGVHWLPPSYTGLSLLHKLDAFMIESPLAPTPPALPPAPQPISTPLPVSTVKEADLLSVLSEREREVLPLVVAGIPYAEIATQLFITENTVKSHAAHIRTKLRLPAHLADQVGLA